MPSSMLRTSGRVTSIAAALVGGGVTRGPEAAAAA